MIFFNNSVMIPRLIYPMFYGFFVGFSCLVEIYPERRGVFLSRDDEKIGVFYFNVFIVGFTVVNLKINVHAVVVVVI